jgi:hypothetical protein
MVIDNEHWPVDSGSPAVLDGGPMDGTEHPVEPLTDEHWITMADNSRHQYLRTSESRVLPDGRTGIAFLWQGRF